MPRPQTPTPGLLTLTPVAAPTDQFVAPEVRGKSSGSELTQLAQALAGLGGVAHQVAERRIQAEHRNWDIEAVGKVAEARQKNLNSFEAAMNAGLLKDTETPYFLDRLREGFAAKSGEDLAKAAWQEYAQSDLRHNPTAGVEQVQQFFNQKAAEATKGLSPAEMAAFGNTYDHHVQGFLYDDLQNRDQQRQEDMMSLLGSDAQTIAERYGYDASSQNLEEVDGAAPGKLQATQGNLQALVDAHKQFVSPQTLNKSIVDSINSVAIRKLDAHFAEHVLSGVKGADGKPMSESAYFKDANDSAVKHIERLRAENVANGRQAEEDEERHEFKRIQAEVGPAYRKAQAEGLGADDVSIPLSSNEAVNERFVRWRAEMKSLEAQNKNFKDTKVYQDALKTFGPGVMAGDATAAINLRQVMFLTRGPQAASDLDQFIYRQKHGDKVEDDRTMVIEAWHQRASSDGLSSEWLLKNQKSFSLETFGRFMGEAIDQESGNRSAAQVQAFQRNGEEDIKTLVIQKAVSTGFYDGSSPLPAELVGDFQAAQMHFNEKLFERTSQEDWKKLTPAQQAKEIDELVNASATLYRGFDKNSFQAFQQKREDQQKSAVQGIVSDSSKSPVPSVSEAAQVDPVIGSLNVDRLGVIKQLVKLPQDPKAKLKASSSAFSLSHPNVDADPILKLENFRMTRSFNQNMNEDSPGSAVNHFGKPGEARFVDVPNRRVYADKQEVIARDQALVQAKKLKERIEKGKVLEQLGPMLDSVGKRLEIGAPISDREKSSIQEMSRLIQSYAYARKYAGYDVEEVKAMPKGAWLNVPLFTNTYDLAQRGEAAAKELGITTPVEKKAFLDAQVKFISERLKGF